MTPAAHCPSCGALADLSGATCPSCSAPTSAGRDNPHVAADPDVTRLVGDSTSDGRHAAAPRRRLSADTPARTRALTSTSWGATTSDIDHGRFAPGALLDDRYRIVGRLGKGGMGEVFRADDLRLGQPVALKFLPESVDRDPARLAQLHTEVRLARQVSHPNVCRVYDVGEFEGHTFLSMEYVDGEDLASLLRRIGRFSQERALELSRQICAGLAAAHDRGVVHRDLKPANIMLDGSGRIRITDFGLAGAAGEVLRAGTPAYMAPEQLSGGEVTPRSDIYSLGLVLYELFTGQRALDAANMAELIAKREQGGITPPTEIVRDLDPAIERVILRCLQPDPARRPSSALAVAAALPGGDPLAAALAAGETPSPEMVAAAGETESVSKPMTVAGAVWVVAACLGILLAYQYALIINRTPTPKPPDALVDRAEDVVQRAGYADRVRSSARGISGDFDWLAYIARTSKDPHRWDRLQTLRPASQIFWYRTSPLPLVPFGNDNPISGVNPPLTTAGMTLSVLDMGGRLTEFIAVPSPVQPPAPGRPFDFAALFDAAGLDVKTFSPAAPQWVPTVFADDRRAWEGRLPESPDLTVHVETASAFGRPVFFEVTGPWTQSVRDVRVSHEPLFNRVIGVTAALVMPALMLVGLVLARRNIKLGRGDRRGATRAAAAVLALTVAAWLLGDVHVGVPDREITRFFAMFGSALFSAGVLWVTYLGVEPYVRRFSPDSLIAWTRLIAGGWRDPLVGRDVLLGISTGLLMTLFFAIHNFIPPLFGKPELPPIVGGNYTALLSMRYALATLFEDTQRALTSGMLGVGGFVVLRILLKKRELAAFAAVICFTPVVLDGMFPPGNAVLAVTLGTLITTGFVIAIAWAGLLATIAALTTHFILLRAPLTTDLSSWKGGTTMVLLGSVLILGLGSALVASGLIKRRNASLS